MVDFGRLKSPLSDYELVMKMIRELWDSCQSHSELKQALGKNDFQGFVNSFMEEMSEIEDVGKKERVKAVRLEETLKSVEGKFKTYRKEIKKISKKDPSAEAQLKGIDLQLAEIKRIKKRIRDEARRAASDQAKVAGNI